MSLFTVTTTEPAFLGIGGEPLTSRKENDPPLEIPFPVQKCYLHGMAEDLAGFDVVIPLAGTLQDLPEQKALLRLANGVDYDLILVMWEMEPEEGDAPGRSRRAGLFVLPNDKESLRYARRKARERSSNI